MCQIDTLKLPAGSSCFSHRIFLLLPQDLPASPTGCSSVSHRMFLRLPQDDALAHAGNPTNPLLLRLAFHSKEPNEPLEGSNSGELRLDHRL